MSRWRPPSAKSSPYITPAGYAALQQELKQLWQKRRIVNDALAAAAAEGDRSENAEYIYRKKEQAGIDRRIRYLQKRLPDLNIIERVGDPERVFFGATITLQKSTLEKSTLEKNTLQKDQQTPLKYRIVGPDETDMQPHYISIDSPLAKALLKKGLDDTVSINIAEQCLEYLILAISYN